MYINVTKLFLLPNPLMLPLLLVLKHASKKDVSELIANLIIEEEDLTELEEKGYIKFVKGKKDDSELHRMRLGKKGTSFLNSLDDPDVEPEDVKIFDWLANIYKKRDKQIGNGKRTQRHIASFRVKSDIDRNRLAFLCEAFINDDDEQEYSHKLENVFWKPVNMFQSKFVLEDSRLWKYYNKRKQYFDNEFKKLK